MEKRKLLLIDDEKSILQALKRELFQWSLENDISILTAASGIEALEILKVENKSIAIIVSDLKMPKIKGSDLLLQIKELYPDIISILLTGFTGVEEMMRTIKAGIFSYILKPWDSDYLKTELTKALNVYTLRQENKRSIKMIKEELKWGGELQKTLLKFDLPPSDKISFSITYNPLPDLNCGGDYYDVFLLSPDKYLVVLGDVAGHGIKAAFVTLMLKSIIYSGYIKKYKDSDFKVEHFFNWLNNEICDEFKRIPDVIVTFSACVFDLNNYNAMYSNAGHLPVFFVRDNKILKLYTPGSGMGMSKDCTYNQKCCNLQKGDKIILYTDGLIETGQDKEIQTGKSRLKKVILENISKTDFNRKILDGILSISCISEYTDDVTLISIDIKK